MRQSSKTTKFPAMCIKNCFELIIDSMTWECVARWTISKALVNELLKSFLLETDFALLLGDISTRVFSLLVGQLQETLPRHGAESSLSEPQPLPGRATGGCRKCYWLHRNRSLQFTYHFATILSVHILDPTECNPVPFQNLCVPAVVNVIDPRGLDPCLGNLRNIRSLASNKQKLESYLVGQFTLAICSHQGGWCKFGCSSCSNPHIPGKIIGSEWFWPIARFFSWSSLDLGKVVAFTAAGDQRLELATLGFSYECQAPCQLGLGWVYGFGANDLGALVGGFGQFFGT